MNAIKRNYGIDLLRLFSMLGVAILHVLGHGGVLRSAVSFSDFSVAWFWELLAYPAVNCFVIISGYVGYRQGKYYPNLNNFINLFLTVLFYSVVICGVFNYFYPNLILYPQVIESFFPITTKQYWFFSIYFALFVISPVLNMIIDKADSTMNTLIFFLPFIYTFFSLHVDSLKLSGGYSLIWFILLYMCGGIIKKVDLASLIGNFKLIAISTIMFLITWFAKLACMSPLANITELKIPRIASALISYSSPTYLLASLFVVCLFSKINVPSIFHKVIAFLTPCAFSVYLIHDNIYFRKFIMSNRFEALNNHNIAITSLCLLAIVLTIFFGCIFIDKIRCFLFKILYIDKLSGLISKQLSKMISKISLESNKVS